MRFKKMGAGAIIATILIPMGMTTAFATTNNIVDSRGTDFVVTEEMDIVEVGDLDVEVAPDVAIFVEWDELKDYVGHGESRAASYLKVENYEYVTYGRIPPQSIKVTTTVDGHEYAGTLTRGDYVYEAAYDKYRGYYSGKIYLQD